MRARLSIWGVVIWVGALCLTSSAWAQQFKEESTSRFSMIYSYYSEGVELGDIDNDGDIDIVFANGEGYSSKGNAQKNEIHINDGKGFFTDETNSRLAGIPITRTRDILLADIDNDGDLDMVEANVFGDPHRVLLNDGKGFFTNATSTWLGTITDYGSDVDAADVNNDGLLDLYFTSTGNKVFGGAGGQDILLIHTGTSFVNETAERLPQVLVAETLGVEFVDVDMDLDLDIYLTNRGPKNQLYLNDGNGYFTDVSSQLPEDGDMSYESVLGDLNGDGFMDAFVANYGPGSGFNEGVSINDGSGKFVDKTKDLFAPGSNIGADDNAAVLVDIDLDSDLDVIVAALNPGYERLYLNDGKGYLTLTPGVIQVQSDSTLECAMADVDNNGTYDLVTANGESGTMKNKLYINSGPKDTNPPQILQVLDLADPDMANVGGPGTVVASVIDDLVQDTPVRLNVVLVLSPEGEALSLPMMWVGGTFYRGVLPAAGVSYQIKAVDRQGNETLSMVYTWPDNSGGEDIGDPPEDANTTDDMSQLDAGGSDIGSADVATDGGTQDTAEPTDTMADVSGTADGAEPDLFGDTTEDTAGAGDAALPRLDTTEPDSQVGTDTNLTDSGGSDTGGTGGDTGGGSGDTADTAAADTAGSGKKSKNEDDGCSTAMNPGSPVAWSLVVLAASLLISRRRQARVR